MPLPRGEEQSRVPVLYQSQLLRYISILLLTKAKAHNHLQSVTLFMWWISAPLSKRNLTVMICPSLAAQIMAVHPLCTTPRRQQPIKSHSTLDIQSDPCPGPRSLTLALWWMSDPLSRSSSTVEVCPFQEARSRAVSPSYATKTQTS